MRWSVSLVTQRLWKIWSYIVLSIWYQRILGHLATNILFVHSLCGMISYHTTENRSRDSRKSRNNLLFSDSSLSYFHAYISPSHHLVELHILCTRITGCFWSISRHPFFGCFFYFLFSIAMDTIQFAQKTRNTLRILQATRWTDSYPRPDKTVYEVILWVTWMVAERLSWEKLPR
jgi:hypothetical protein